MRKRRAFEVFTLSFLDCICCGFGAVVLFYTIIQAQAGAQEVARVDQLTGEVRKLEEEVLVGQRNLVLLRNTLEKTDSDAAAAKARAINNVLTAARNITPQDGTSLVNALLMMRTIEPQPDQVILITDGLPTQGSVAPSRKFINAKEREKLFDDAAKTVNKDIPIDIVLLPMKGDPPASYSYWRLARKTGGAFVIPSRDWP